MSLLSKEERINRLKNTSAEERLMLLRHDTLRIIPIMLLIAEYLRDIGSRRVEGLPEDLNKWAEQLTEAASNLRDMLDVYAPPK